MLILRTDCKLDKAGCEIEVPRRDGEQSHLDLESNEVVGLARVRSQ